MESLALIALVVLLVFIVPKLARRAPALPLGKSRVYILVTGEPIDGEHRYKIGYTTTSVRKRVNGLKTGCPTTLNIAATIEGGTRAHESGLHTLFADDSRHLEWFALSPGWEDTTNDWLAQVGAPPLTRS